MMDVKQLRVYADSSVIGGVFDAEFEAVSQMFFRQVQEGRFQLVTSAVVQAEIAFAPSRVQEFFAQILSLAEITDVTAEAVQLQQAYLKAGILSPKWATDALHVALATVSQCSLIVSWNFKHIVHFEKIPLYNAVNTLEGYDTIAIYSPREVIAYED